MLSGVVSFTILNAFSAQARDLKPVGKLPAMTIPSPAVDGINSKLDGFAGSVGNKTVYGAEGSFSVPLQSRYGAQLDGRAGNFDGNAFGAVGGHLFWRDPSTALVGAYGDFTNWDRFGGVQVAHVAGEGAYYFGRFTLEGVAGIELGNSASKSTLFSASGTSINSSSSTTTIPQNGVIPGTTTTTITTVTTTTTTNTLLTQSFNIKTRFFDQINLAYYPTDDWKAYVGHRYLGGQHAVALGTELARPLSPGILGSAFVEARFGDHDFHGVWGGVKLYFGQSDKPLMARHRRDDPPLWIADSLFSIINNQGSSLTSATSQSSTTSTNSSSQQFCDSGSEFPVLSGGVCTF
jgi:hypothetical protein